MEVLTRYTQEEFPIDTTPPSGDMWKDTFIKMLEEYCEMQKEIPGNTETIHRIRQLKQILYQWYLIDQEELWFCKKRELTKQQELEF